MIKYLPVILICNIGMPSDKCIESNKDVTVTYGEPQMTPISCLINGQTQIAQIAIAPKQDESSYVLIKCRPKEYD